MPECINTLDLFVSTATDLSETCLSESELDLLDDILQNSFPYMHGPSLGPLLETVVVQPSIPSGEKQTPTQTSNTNQYPTIGTYNNTWNSLCPDNSENNYSYFDEYTNQLTPESDHGYDSLTESFQSSQTGACRLQNSIKVKHLKVLLKSERSFLWCVLYR